MIAANISATLPSGRPLPRVLYAIALDGTQKLGSLEEQIFILAKAFHAEGSLLLPVFLEPDGPAQTGTAVFEAAGLPSAALSLWHFRWKKLLRLNELISRHQIQLVHWSFYAPVNGYMLALSALRPRLRHYFTDHNSRDLPMPAPARGIGGLVKSVLLKRYRKVWCVSHFVHDCLTAQRNWSNLECCLHFINTDRFRPDRKVREAIRREHGCENRFVALAVAHLIPQKGIDVAIRAIALTPAHAALWIVGGGDESANLKALAVELGVEDRVKFFGQQALVQPFMQGADCLVCPSLWAEAAGLVNIEALSTGLPVVASRVGGIPEYIDDGNTGILFPAGNHQALAESICRLAEKTPEECRLLSEVARATAVERFSVASKINDYLDLYRCCH